MQFYQQIETGRKTKKDSKATAASVSRVGRNMVSDEVRVSVGPKEEKRSEKRSEKRGATTRKSDLRIGWRNVRSGVTNESRMRTRKAERSDLTTTNAEGAVVAC